MSNAAPTHGSFGADEEVSKRGVVVDIDARRKDSVARPLHPSHVVQFYESEEFLGKTVTEFLGAGLGGGEMVIVIATEPHRRAFCLGLRANGFDVDRVCETGQLTLLDARETLARFMVGRLPDPKLFESVIGATIEKSVAERPGARVRAYGEMVDVLWRDGNGEGAIRLEELWNELGAVHSFSLLCAYAMEHFAEEADGRHFDHVCRAHTHVFPTESYSELEGSDARLREIGLLQQRARALASEVASRKVAEESLRFLVEAGEIIGSSLDYETTLTAVARLSVPRLADWVTIDIKDGPDGPVERLAVAHSDPAKLEMARELRKRLPAQHDGPHGVAQVLRTGQPEILSEIPDSLLSAAISDPETLRMVRGLGLHASMCVPLCVGGEAIGAITFISAESGRVFTESDLHVARELARRASLAIEHAKLYEGARTANRMKDEFLATVSHELRTPLNAILGWARILRTGTLSGEKFDRALCSIERNSVAQAQLIDDLLDVSGIISGKMRLDVQQVDLALVAEAAIDSMRPALQAKDLGFSLVIDSNAGKVAGDSSRLQQVLWNLISNAVKFTPKGGRVELVLARAHSDIELTVTDTGEGIPKTQLRAIFERFKQVDGSTTRLHGGLGMGLAISRHIVELHGGSIEARSDGPGCGATFVVRLPVSASASKPQTAGPFVETRSSSSFRAPAFEGLEELVGLSVLLIDDERDTRELLTELLEQCGCTIHAASSADEGLAILDEVSPQVILSDIGMPGTDGYAFIEKVRARPRAKGGGIPAAALTGFTSAEDRSRALRAGFQMHIRKPIEPAELVANLANLAQLASAVEARA
jgi:signal transduction histidine kinase/ActR/RegA family two-component response regulator